MKEVRTVDDKTADPENLRPGAFTEISETERLDRAAEQLNRIEELRPQSWSRLNATQREWCLRRVGQNLSDAYECPAPLFIGSTMPELAGGVLLGEHSDSENITRMNRDLLRDESGDKALETYCHEFRHAYQHEMATRYNSAFRHLCHDEAAAGQWAANLDGGYVSFEQTPEGYEGQPVERDARDFAQKIVAEVQRRRST